MTFKVMVNNKLVCRVSNIKNTRYIRDEGMLCLDRMNWQVLQKQEENTDMKFTIKKMQLRSWNTQWYMIKVYRRC